ncbi:MAG: hypothetical protein KDB05_31930 [Planctomycetales bacterium]|nr:hypothetical protein [Planctomycetales bacterium]
MSIEFGCCECGKLLRVPETSAGKKARCPACGAIQEVASPVTPTSPQPDAASDHDLVSAVSPAPQTPPPDSPFAASASSSNPFADQTSTKSDNPFAAGSTNPYATPASGTGTVSQGLFGPGSRVWARTSVEGPANSLAAVGGVVIIFSGLGFAINLFEFIESGSPEVMIYSLVGTLVLMIPYGIVIFGATRMKQLKNYPLAIAASILAMLPCSACCILGLPVGIWSLVVLCNRDIRDAFRQSA